jgi:hypothetical protein
VLAMNGVGSGLESLTVGDSTAFFLDSSGNIDSCSGSGCGLSPTIYEAVSDGGFYQSLVSDSTNTYFTDGQSLYSCPLGATCSTPVTLATVTGSERIGALALSPTEVFYVRTGYTNYILAIPIGGGKTREVTKAGPLAMVVTNDYVYNTDPDSIFLSYCLADGGSSGGDLVFAVGLLPYGLATDGTNLYWTNYVASGTVATCAVGGEDTCLSPGIVASDQGQPLAIAVNAAAVYWTTATAIYTAPK